MDSSLPGYIVEKAKERFEDKQTGYFIAVKRVPIHGEQREVMVAYKEKAGVTTLVTIHPLKEGQKDNRIRTGRWQRL